MFASCKPQPNWIPRKPKLMFEICQKLKRGLFIVLVLQTLAVSRCRGLASCCAEGLSTSVSISIQTGGSAPNLGGTARKTKERHRKGIAFPHIRRQSRVFKIYLAYKLMSSSTTLRSNDKTYISVRAIFET